MTKQFNIKKIRNDIYLVTEPWFREHADLYVIKGNAYDLLIDCGLGVFNIKEFLQQKGFKPKVFLTHAHFDHAGGIRHFLPSEILATAPVLKSLKKRKLWGLKYLKPEFFDERVLKQSTDRAAEDIVRDYKVEVPKGIEPVKSNILKVGKYNFQIIPSPGHTSDSVLLFDPRNKILVSGDTLYDGTPYASFPDSNKKEFLKSLETINSLDYQFLLPGHNKMLNKKRAQKVIENWEDLLR